MEVIVERRSHVKFVLSTPTLRGKDLCPCVILECDMYIIWFVNKLIDLFCVLLYIVSH